MNQRTMGFVVCGLVGVGCIVVVMKRKPMAERSPARANQTLLALDLAQEPSVPRPVAESGLTLIDGMGSGTNALDGPTLTGYWYAYSDKTGSLAPAEGSRYFATTEYKGRLARECKGSGQSIWGAGYGFDLNDAAPKGNEQSGATALDASAYTGIRFDGASASGRVNVWVTFSDGNTNPGGGVCDPLSVIPATQCHGDYRAIVELKPEWTTHTIAFTQLVLPSWTQLGPARADGLQRNKLYSIHFELQIQASEPLPAFDFFVSSVYFTKPPAHDGL